MASETHAPSSLHRYVRDPVSGLTHLAGALLGVVALFFLLSRAGSDTNKVIAATVFGLSIVLLYSSSALYHLLPVGETHQRLLRRLDHTMIFVLIAGTYTPYCLLALGEPFGRQLLTVIWLLAFAGLGRTLFWLEAPRGISTGLYLLMGWIAVIAVRPLVQALSFSGMAWLIAGGAFYSIGAVVYGFKRPNPFPPHFGFHEIWHLFVLSGSTCHFISVTTLI